MLAEFERIAERGGVLGAMETGYQRGKIQDESMHYEMLKHTGELPIIGVNTFRNPKGDPIPQALELARSTEEEKHSQLRRLEEFHARHAAQAPGGRVYIANVLKCRPPGNRNPEPLELQTCTPYLMRQLALVQPQIILAMGRFAVQSLLQTTEPIGKLRGACTRSRACRWW